MTVMQTFWSYFKIIFAILCCIAKRQAQNMCCQWLGSFHVKLQIHILIYWVVLYRLMSVSRGSRLEPQNWLQNKHIFTRVLLQIIMWGSVVQKHFGNGACTVCQWSVSSGFCCIAAVSPCTQTCGFKASVTSVFGSAVWFILCHRHMCAGRLWRTLKDEDAYHRGLRRQGKHDQSKGLMFL